MTSRHHGKTELLKVTAKVWYTVNSWYILLYVWRGLGKWSWMDWESRNKKGTIPGSRKNMKILLFWPIIIIKHQSLNREGCWGATDDFTTSFLHFSLFSTALWDMVNSRPVHSLMLSSHLFLCLPCLLPPFTLPCKIVLTRPDEWEKCPYHRSFYLFTMVRRS